MDATGRTGTDRIPAKGITFIVREKGRNAAVALEKELGNAAEPILDLVNGDGKDAAKTGEDWATTAARAAKQDAVTLKDTGRQYPRPVFTAAEDSDTVIRGRETPAAAIDEQVDRFYAGYDELLDYGLETGDVAAGTLQDGFDRAVNRYLDQSGYDRTGVLGDTITWAVMDREQVPDETDTVLVPDGFAALGTALAEQRYDNVDTVTFQDYAETQELQEIEEEAVIAAADVPGIYMYDTGRTAEENRLEYEPVMDGAVSRLGRFTYTGGPG